MNYAPGSATSLMNRLTAGGELASILFRVASQLECKLALRSESRRANAWLLRPKPAARPHPFGSLSGSLNGCSVRKILETKIP